MNAKHRGKYDEFVRKYPDPRQALVLEQVNRSIEQHQLTGGVTVLTGPTGIGKSHLKERIRYAMVTAFIKSKGSSDKMPFLGVTATPPIHDTFRFTALWREILEKADEPLRDVPLSKPVEYRTSDALQLAAMNVLRYRQPRVFCIDEAQHITYAVQEMRLAQHLDLVKWIASESKRPVLMVGTYELLRFSRVSGQLGRRVNHIPFMPYDWASDDDRPEFKKAAAFFIQHLPVRLRLNVDTDDDLRLLFAGCLGSVGLLKEWFERALFECLSDERSSLNRSELEAARMPKGKLLKIAHEMEQGRLELKLMNDDKGEIEELLGMKVEKNVKPKARPTMLPGTRKLGRDPVDSATAA